MHISEYMLKRRKKKILRAICVLKSDMAVGQALSIVVVDFSLMDRGIDITDSDPEPCPKLLGPLKATSVTHVQQFQRRTQYGSPHFTHGPTTSVRDKRSLTDIRFGRGQSCISRS